jgi:thiamine biosynthesis protein ThiI
MMRIAERIARQEGCEALITGESIGQVASQTMQALGTTDAVAEMPVFRPLIGFDKEEIIEKAQKIGTFETSILPYEDCCTVFVPKHPVTKPKVDRLRESEALVDFEPMIQKAISEAECMHIG